MQELKALPLGRDDFRKIIENDCYYVDKTPLIKKLLQTKSEVSLITRPRRFGKTLAMSMLQNFFEYTEEPAEDLFCNLKIEQEKEICSKYKGQYPVISLSLKSAKQGNFKNAFEMLKQTISHEFRRHEKAVLAYDYEKERIVRLLNAQGDESDYLASLQFLSQILYETYEKKVIILIDEYDVPLENAYFEGFYDDMVMFIRSLFESALKTNPCLEFAVVTGCLRISKESIFTGLNNLHIVSILNNGYAEYFGFTEDEVKKLLAYYGLSERMPDMKEWYDGYQFGNVEIYNPWSVLSFISDLLEDERTFPKPYWSNTSSNSIIKTLIESADLKTRSEIENLVDGNIIKSAVHEDITYSNIHDSKENLWNFLFFTGYLKKVSESLSDGQVYIGMKIPNEEIRYIYKTKITEWTQERIKRTDLSVFYQAMFTGKTDKFQQELEKQLHESISYFDVKEAFYHGFLLGVLSNVQEYLVESNGEAGDGRPDILLKSYDVRKPAVIIEIKHAKMFKDMREMAETALIQIDEKHYARELERDGYENINKYGISFYKKNCYVAKK